MILACIAIAGLLLSNKDDVVSFINKHNINWFERNLESNTQINKQTQYKGNGNNNKINGPQMTTKNTKVAPPPMDDNVAAVKDSIMMTNDPNNRASQKMHQISQTTVIAITNPPIQSDVPTTQQYAPPAWKNLINKIVNSNKNEFVAVNSIGNLNKPLSTMVAQIKTTTNPTPTKIITLAPVQQHESSKLFCVV